MIPKFKNALIFANIRYRALNFNNNPLLLGGLENADPVLERPGQVHSDDFVGCVHSVSINGRALNLTNPLASRGVKSTCVRSQRNPCLRDKQDAVSVCGVDSQCHDKWHQVMCQCGSLIAPNCHSALKPVTLSEGGFIEFKVKINKPLIPYTILYYSH